MRRPSFNFCFNSKNWAVKGKALWPTCYTCLQKDILILTVLAWLPVVWHLTKDKQGAPSGVIYN